MVVAILRAFRALCVLSLSLLYSQAIENTCRHREPSRKCLRTKVLLAEYRLWSPLQTFEGERVHRFGATQEGFAPRLRPLRAQAPDVPGRSMPGALACD